MPQEAILCFLGRLIPPSPLRFHASAARLRRAFLLFPLPLSMLFDIRHQQLRRSQPTPLLHRLRDWLLGPRKPNQHLGARQVSAESLLRQQIGQLLRVLAHPPVRRLAQPLYAVLARRLSAIPTPCSPFTFPLCGCPACFPARIVCLQRLICYRHLSAIPGQRSTNPRARRKGASAAIPLWNCPENTLSESSRKPYKNVDALRLPCARAAEMARTRSGRLSPALRSALYSFPVCLLPAYRKTAQFSANRLHTTCPVISGACANPANSLTC